MRPFRPARPASLTVNVLKTLAQAAVFWSVFLVVLPRLIAAVEVRVLGGLVDLAGQRALASVLFAVAAAVNLSSGWLMATVGEGTPFPLDTARKLVVRGPYRYLRNPMAVSGLLLGGAVGLWLGSRLSLAYIVAGGVLWHLVARPPEERDLEERFGDDYRAYRAAVRCWLPRLRAYRPEDTGSG